MKFSTFFAFAALTFASAVQAGSDEWIPVHLRDESNIQIETPFKNCGAPNDILAVKEVTFSPDPPKAGELLTVGASGITSAPIVNGSTVSVTVKVGPVIALQKTLDLCSLSGPEAGLPCPIPPGNQVLKIGVDIPSNTPKLSFNIKAVAKNPDGRQIVCIEGRVKITFKEGESFATVASKL